MKSVKNIVRNALAPWGDLSYCDNTMHLAVCIGILSLEVLAVMAAILTFSAFYFCGVSIISIAILILSLTAIGSIIYWYYQNYNE